MKKIFDFAKVILLVLLFPLMSKAQIDFGIKGGLSIPNLTSGSSDNPVNSGYGSRLGPDFGIHAEFHFNHLSIQPELHYSSQGGKKNGDQGFAIPGEFVPFFPPGQVPQYLYANYKSEAKFNYLMLPILVKFHFLKSFPWDFYASVGPFASFLLNAKNVTSGSSIIYLDPAHTQPLTPSSQPFDSTRNIKSDLHAANVGIDGHIGLAYHFGKNNSVFIEGGGNYGFVNIQKDAKNGKNNTGAAVVLLGYAFRVAGKKARTH